MMKLHQYRTWMFFSVMGFALALVVSSCEKIIELKLGTIEPKYVIEANMSNEIGDCQVLISKSIKVEDRNEFPSVENAQVTIQEEGGPLVKLEQISPGSYVSWEITAHQGKTYTLRVQVEGQTFISVCKVPQKVHFDSLYIADFQGFGDTRKFAYVNFRDPAETPNWYRFLQCKNEVQNSNIFIISDQYSNGRPISTFLAYFDQSDVQRIDVGDTITVEMQDIDKHVYDFFQSLSQSSTGGTEVISPGNPVTNITGGALGYFNAYIKQSKTLIVE